MRACSPAQRAGPGIHGVDALVPIALVVLFLGIFERLLQLVPDLLGVLFLHLGLEHGNAVLAVRFLVGPGSSRNEQREKDCDQDSVAHGVYLVDDVPAERMPLPSSACKRYCASRPAAWCRDAPA